MLIQGCDLEAALGERTDLTDEEWAVIGPLLPSGRGCRPAQEIVDILKVWMARTGA